MELSTVLQSWVKILPPKPVQIIYLIVLFNISESRLVIIIENFDFVY